MKHFSMLGSARYLYLYSMVTVLYTEIYFTTPPSVQKACQSANKAILGPGGCMQWFTITAARYNYLFFSPGLWLACGWLSEISH